MDRNGARKGRANVLHTAAVAARGVLGRRQDTRRMLTPPRKGAERSATLRAADRCRHPSGKQSYTRNLGEERSGKLSLRRINAGEGVPDFET